MMKKARVYRIVGEDMQAHMVTVIEEYFKAGWQLNAVFPLGFEIWMVFSGDEGAV